MANPDLCNPTKVEAKNAKQAVGTSATAIVSNSASSNKTLRAVSLYIANIDGTNAASITVDVYNGTTATNLCKTVSVPANSTLSVIAKDEPVYLMEGDSLRLTASSASKLEAVASYEEIS